ncbi:unnamed protein product [Brassicogethes aeneus]|uniref:Fibronectin type-III domain-containing protein n=1 Tax=Brassicogethes aeneus TaxID=1431903 RepID=A0A9P0BH53_BRAAE|nr:unnamed protein product [Brassicogethes aeneus]
MCIMWTLLTSFLTVLSVLTVTFTTGFAERRNFDVTSLHTEIITVKAGENKSLPCPGVNEHSLVSALEWFTLTHQIKLVEFASDSTTVWDHEHRISLILENYALNFHPAVAEDSGDYICLVNSRPKPDGIIRFIVKDVPDPPGRPLFMSFTSRSVNLSWAPSQHTHYSPIINYVIHVRVGEEGEWDEMDTVLTKNNETIYHIKNLHPYTVYSFRVIAVNELGESQPMPTGKPTITTAHNTSASAIHISWRAPPSDMIHGEFLGYRIAYRPRDMGNEAFQEVYIRDPSVEVIHF